MARKIVSYSPSDLRPHPSNKEVYGPPKSNDRYDEIYNNMKRGGYDERHPLLVTRDGRIISGVTRWWAARSLKLEEVPCEVFEPPDEETAEAIIEEKLFLENLYRTKTRLMKAREQQKLVEIQKILARKRMAHGRDDDDAGPSKSTERVAKICKTSNQTVRRNLKVLKGIDAAVARGDEHMARHLIELLEQDKPGKAIDLIDGTVKGKPKAPVKVDVPRTPLDHSLAAYREFYEACATSKAEAELQALEQDLERMREALQTARARLTHGK
jgi:ParB-like chromosome segregation protein Spo0J